jgi:hypothetical protein
MAHLALLAPVPVEHLEDAIKVCERTGRVAFGSRASGVFRELDECRIGLPVSVYIYASGEPGSAFPEVLWVGRYVGQVEGKNGTHPDGMKHRPRSTGKYPTDNKGNWAIFWELDQILRLKPEERRSMNSFTGYKSGKAYKKHFIPRGPMLVTSSTQPFTGIT